MNYSQRVESPANHICHMVSENESITLSDKSRSDIFLTVRSVADYWKKDSDKLREENHAKRWNELKLWLMRYPLTKTVEDIQIVMAMLDRGEYIRDYKPKYIQQLEQETLSERKGSNGIMQGTIENTY